MHAQAFPVTGPFSKEVSEKTFFLAVGFFKNLLFFPPYPLAERQLARKTQDNLEKETRVKNPLGQDESFSKMML